jgi:hypothetical protein
VGRSRRCGSRARRGGRGLDRPALRPAARDPHALGDRYVTLGAYVLDGRFVGYFARVTPQSHVGHDALCVPVFVGDEGAR